METSLGIVMLAATSAAVLVTASANPAAAAAEEIASMTADAHAVESRLVIVSTTDAQSVPQATVYVMTTLLLACSCLLFGALIWTDTSSKVPAAANV
jgi:hypothetical protein